MLKLVDLLDKYCIMNVVLKNIFKINKKKNKVIFCCFSNVPYFLSFNFYLFFDLFNSFIKLVPDSFTLYKIAVMQLLFLLKLVNFINKKLF